MYVYLVVVSSQILPKFKIEIKLIRDVVKDKFKSYVYVISALIYLFISLSELFKCIIESISCRKIEDIKYILADLNEICYSD